MVIFLAVAFLVYGLVRTGICIFLISQKLRIFDTVAGRELIENLETSLAQRSSAPFVLVTSEVYIVYTLTMGLFMMIASGAIVMNRDWGYLLLSITYLMYALVFLNFKVTDVKLLSLMISGICLVALLAMAA